MFGQLIVSGLAVGACYSLLALAMVIIYKTSEVLNFAQGEMAMISTYVAFTILDSYHVPFPWAVALTFLFAILLGIFFEIAFLRQAKDPTVLGLMIITLGFEMVLMGFAGWKWGPDQRPFPFPVSSVETYNVSGLLISKINFWTILISLVLMLVLFLFFRYTKLGIAMRATQQNPLAARVMGIRTKRILSFTWALSSMVGAVAGMLIAALGVLDPPMMMDPLLKGFASAVLGGMTSLPGSALGGALLGIIENLFGGYVSLAFKSVVAFAIIVLMLCIRPSGLLARHYEKKV
ncbi:MAG TPA: branched-chain amino acid ABC transporter permease [Thermodesulfobacteriota bacterium]|nr:branched-chain amino acid ABC transporter permease [Thermodesulfobacteriota bacterium]